MIYLLLEGWQYNCQHKSRVHLSVLFMSLQVTRIFNTETISTKIEIWKILSLQAAKVITFCWRFELKLCQICFQYCWLVILGNCLESCDQDSNYNSVIPFSSLILLQEINLRQFVRLGCSTILTVFVDHYLWNNLTLKLEMI